MSGQEIGCNNCGAVMIPAADGQLYSCQYCGARRLIGVDATQIAKGMAADLSDVGAFLNHLAHTLETAVADRTKVQRRGSDVVVIELNLAPDMFIAKREGHEVIAQHKRMSRGIALKTAAHPLDSWVEMLCERLAAHANENARATAAVAAIRSGR